jgi:ATP-dependent Clp protease ATP-binding subunit ClpC
MNTHFSSSLKEIISLSREEAIRLHSDTIGTGHLLLALRPELQKEIEAGIAEEQGSVANVGKAMVFQKKRLFSLFRRDRTGMQLSREAEKAIRGAIVQAKDRQSPVVEPGHLLLSILKDANEKWKALLINPL